MDGNKHCHQALHASLGSPCNPCDACTACQRNLEQQVQDGKKTPMWLWASSSHGVSCFRHNKREPVALVPRPAHLNAYSGMTIRRLDIV